VHFARLNAPYEALMMESLTPQATAIAVIMASLVLLAAVKLFWGMALWAKKSDHRLGERWGEEPVEVVEWGGREGYVRAGGELWRAASADALSVGERVRVLKTKGLVLEVKKIPAHKAQSEE
jgi:membrane-bound ClpP family serine protease